MKKSILLSICLAALIPGMVQAAGMATATTANNGTGHIYWQNETIVVDAPPGKQLAAFMLRQDDIYFIYPPGTKPRVVEMSGMLGMLRSMQSSSNGLTGLMGRITSVKATGETETVAGIEGRVYRVTLARDGKSKTYEVVLTDNPTVVELTGIAMARMVSVLGDQSAVMESYVSALPEDYRGILRIGDRFQLTAVSSENPPDKRFQLPAEPVSFAQAMVQQIAG